MAWYVPLMESRITKLPNGATFIFAQADTPSYAVMPIMQTGHYDEIYKRPGLAHFVEHMLFEGSPYLKPGELMHEYPKQFFQKSNASTNMDRTILFSSGSSDSYYFKPEELVAGFLPVIKNAFSICFTPDAVEQERLRIVSEIAGGLQTHDKLGKQAVARRKFNFDMYNEPYLLWPHHLGSIENAQATSRAELIDFHEKYYSGKRLRIFCEGPQYPVELVERLSALDLPTGKPFSRKPMATCAAEGVYHPDVAHTNEVRIILPVGLQQGSDLKAGFTGALVAGYLDLFWNGLVNNEKICYAAGIYSTRNLREGEFECFYSYENSQKGHDLWQRFIEHVSDVAVQPDLETIDYLQKRSVDTFTRYPIGQGTKNNWNYNSFLEDGTAIDKTILIRSWQAIQAEDVQAMCKRILAATPAVYSICAPGQQLEQPRIAEILKAAVPSPDKATAPQPAAGELTSASSPDRPSRYSRPGGDTAYSGPR